MDENSSYHKFNGIPVIENGIPSSKITLRAYREDSFGKLVQQSFWAISLYFIFVMCLLTFDYYEIFHKYAGQTTMVFDNHSNLSKVFIAYWHLMTVWFLVYYTKGTSLVTFFMANCGVQQASHILVEVQRQTQVKAADLGRLVEIAQKIESWFKKYTKSNVSKELVPLQRSNSGHPFIEYECVRYIFNTKSSVFEPYQFKVGENNFDILASAKGITDSEAQRRMELSGPNEILFTFSSFATALKQE